MYEFANAANRELYAKVKEKEKKMALVTEDLKETQDRIEVMKSHLASVVAEQQNTQLLVDSKIKEIETEDHLKQLAERERGRFTVEYKKIQAEKSSLQDKISALQTSIFKGNEKMDQFKLQMNWNQEELEQWALAARQKEEDNLALLKYTKADESRMKELNLQLEKMLSAVQSKHAELEAEITETQAKQIELDKTAEDFRSLHRERRELVSQWEAAVAAMTTRDEAITAAHEEFARAKADLRERQDQLAEKAAFLKTEEKNNFEVEMKIGAAERTIGKKREIQLSEAARLSELNDQVEVLRATLAKAAGEMAKRKANCNELQGTVEDRKKRLDRAKKQLTRAERDAERSKQSMGDLEKAAKQMEEVHAEEAARLKAIEKEAALVKDAMFAESQRLFEAKKDEATLNAEISGAQRASRNASHRIAQLDEEAQRQKELVYTAEFQLQLMERKVARASGVRSVAEQTELKKKIADLTQQLDQQTATYSMLSAQGKRLANDLKRAKRSSEDLEHDDTRLQAAISEVEMNNDLAQRQLKKLVATKEESMVSADVLKLEVKRLRETLNSKADEVFGLQNRKFQLQMSMDERQQEIKVHSDVLRAQYKAAEDERHNVHKELTARLTKVDRLTNKYEIICGRMGAADGDQNTEEHSQAYYVIKAAQEREELQRQGDELDQQIQKAEREVRALEKTLAHLFAKNAGYKQSFQPVDSKTPQYEQKVLLEEQHRAALSKYRSHRLQHSELEEEIGQLEQTMKEISEDQALAQQKLISTAEESSALGNELAEQSSLLEQTKAQVGALLAEHRQQAAARGVTSSTVLELETQVSSKRATNKSLLEGLTLVLQDDPAAASVLEQRCAEAGIPPPADMIVDDFGE